MKKEFEFEGGVAVGNSNPEARGSPHMGIWFRDADGYRWELSVQGGVE